MVRGGAGRLKLNSRKGQSMNRELSCVTEADTAVHTAGVLLVLSLPALGGPLPALWGSLLDLWGSLLSPSAQHLVGAQ